MPQSIILVVDDESLILRAISRMLTNQGYTVLAASNGEEALATLQTREIDIALIDYQMPGMDGIEVLRRAREFAPFTEFIIMTARGDVNVAFSALDAGASDYFEKPIQDWQRFQQVLRRSSEVRELRTRAPSRGHGTGHGRPHGTDSPVERLIIGSSPGIQRVKTLIQNVAGSTANILVTGESGTGKDVVARAIHAESGRAGRLEAINCAAIPGDLIESELFGVKKGAYTGAVADKPGRCELSSDGTLFLDEIGDMPVDLQTKLLRVLENRAFRRVGGTRDQHFTARVVAATNQNLEQAIRDKSFRNDLYYRLNTIVVSIPPLRERPEDIPVLAYYFLKQHAEAENRHIRSVPPEVLRRLVDYDWPGNVRELRNICQRLVLLSFGDQLDPSALDSAIARGGGGLARRPMVPGGGSADAGSDDEGLVALSEELFEHTYRDAKEEVLDAFSRTYLTTLLARSGGNITQAAASAGMHRPNFKRLMKKYGVEVPTTE